MEYQIRRETNGGLFHIVFVNPELEEVVRISGDTIDEQISNCKPGVKKVPHELLDFVDKINKFHIRTKDSKQMVPWHLLRETKYHPYDYQKIAIQLMYQSYRKINCLEMGLGKTFTLITLLRIMKAEFTLKLVDKSQPVHLFSLIVLPPRLKGQWKKEIHKFAPELTLREIESGDKACFDPNVDIILLSDGLLDNVDMIEKIIKTAPKFSLLGVDEAQSMKNYKSARSKAMYRLSCHTSRLILMTGTPSMDHKTTYGLLRLVHPIFHKFFHFKPFPLPKTDESFWYALRYCGPFRRPIGRGKFVWEFNIDHRKAELHAIMSEFIIHMTKKDCLKDLPKMTEHVVFLKPPNKKYKVEFEQGVEESKKMREKNGNMANKLLMDLVRKTAEIKIPLVLEYLKKDLQSHSEKIAIFLHHRVLSEGLIDGFTKANIKYLNINADVPIPKREQMIDDFKDSRDERVLIVSYGCCAVGLNNLTFISLCYCVERIYDAVLVKQSKSRFHRIGQHNPVTITFLDLPDSTDTMLEQNFNRKNKSNDFLLHNDDDPRVCTFSENNVLEVKQSLEDSFTKKLTKKRPFSIRKIADSCKKQSASHSLLKKSKPEINRIMHMLVSL
jgi:SNF2 family DNA or RNA helicase